MIRNNLFYKLLALGVAIGLWTYVNSEQNPHAQKTLAIPIELRNVAKGCDSEASVDKATVTIQGLKTVVDTVRPEDVGTWVDLGGIAADGGVTTRQLKLNTRIAGVSADDLDVSVVPRDVKVRVEALSGKRLPVEVKFLSGPPLGYSYSDPAITPASVGISGKITQVLRVRKVLLPLQGGLSGHPIDDDFKVVPVDSKGAVVTGVTLDTSTVRLKLGFVEVAATKAVFVSQNIVGQPKGQNRVSRVVVAPATVTLEGKPSALMSVSTITTDPVSIDGAQETVTLEVPLRVPPGIRAMGVRKVRVTVYVGAPDKAPKPGALVPGTSPIGPYSETPIPQPLGG